MGLTTRELDDVGTDAGGLAPQHGHRFAVDEVVAGGHLGNDETGTQASGESAEGSVGDA
jgi:hypothetical protein